MGSTRGLSSAGDVLEMSVVRDVGRVCVWLGAGWELLGVSE